VKRRQFISLLGGAACAWPLAARAQQQEKIPRIGVIDDAPMWNAFREGLRDLGYLEGQNIAFEYGTADGVPERLAEAATDLVRNLRDTVEHRGQGSDHDDSHRNDWSGRCRAHRAGARPCPSGRQHYGQYHPRP
jgi:hypothetical protein